MIAPEVPGKIDENAWVVHDLESAIGHWLGCGFGPFFVTRMDLPAVRYRGCEVPLSLKIAMARAGEVQIELIQQLSDGPSAYRDVYPVGRSGLHHIRRKAVGRPGDTDDYDALVASFARQGIEIAMEMQFGAQRIGYADTRATLGCMLEIYDPSAAVDSLNRITAAAATDWDGSDPVRMLNLADL